LRADPSRLKIVQLRPAQVFPKAQIPVAGAGNFTNVWSVATKRAGLEPILRQKISSPYYEYVAGREIFQNILIYFCFSTEMGKILEKKGNLTEV
jgi:hypothetical protein